MEAFWEHGYCATSMARLVEATELKPGSLYAAFKSKEGLFLAVLDYYGERSKARIKQALSTSDSPLEGIRAYFQQLVDSMTTPGARHSCLLVNTVLELAREDAAVREQVNRHFNAIETCFRSALEDARVRGELAPHKDPAALAAFLMSGIWGLRVLAGTAPEQDRAQAIVEQLLKLLE
jgi:TetR/AcrR family transcriptional repressor of nem operon